MSTLGNRLKKARENKRMTQIEVSKLLGISNGTLSGYERDYRDPDTDTLSKLATMYEISIDWLLTGEQDGAKTNEGPNLQAFTYRLTNGLKEKNINAEQAAEECGVTLEYIQELMNAPKKLPGATTLLNLAILLDVTPDYLGGFTDDPKGYSPHTPKPRDLRTVLEEEEIMFDGAPLSEDDKEMILGVINALNVKAKKMNKRKKGTS